MNYDKIYQDFIGKDKIQPISIKTLDDNTWSLKYREGRIVREIECDNREDLDKILIEFGGKNPETCKAGGRFLELDGGWGAEDLYKLGHRITKICLTGQRHTRQKTIPFELPEGTGHQNAMKAKKQFGTNSIMLKMKDREDVTFTRSFSEKEEFDALIDHIKLHPSLKDLKWYVKLIGTESRETGGQCVWKRVQAGDGTRRMVLELREINGKDFRDCVRQDVFNAAGDMFDAPCRRITLKKKKASEKNICLFAAEDGDVNIDGYEAVN